jgi:hypothetical protein
LAAIAKGLGEALTGLIREWQRDRLIRRQVRDEAARIDAERKVVEHEQVADVERRDLPDHAAGPRVREVRGKLGGSPRGSAAPLPRGEPPGPGGA